MISLYYKLPNRIRISIEMLCVFLILFTLFRIGFILVFFEEIESLSLNLLFKSLFIGLKFDLRLAIYIILPFLLFSIIPLFNSNFFHKICCNGCCNLKNGPTYLPTQLQQSKTNCRLQYYH